MPSLETEEQLSPAESHLARRLLDSASQDDVTAAETQAAWTKLAGSLSLVALRTSAPVPEAATTSLRRVKLGASRLLWLALGAVAGSIVTAVWLGAAPEPASTAAAPVVASSAPPASAAPTPSTTSAESAPIASHRVPGAAMARRAPSPAPAVPHASTLAAEVAQLDAARTALEIGAFDEAKRLLAEFPQKFPAGELGVEAEVLRLELLAATGDHASAQRAAASFLATHARDPHAARVRQLAEEGQFR